MYSRITYDCLATVCPDEYKAFSEALDALDDNDNTVYLLGERYKLACEYSHDRHDPEIDPDETPKEYGLACAIEDLISALKAKGVPARAGVIDNEESVSVEFVITDGALYTRSFSERGQKIADILGVKSFESCPDVEV